MLVYYFSKYPLRPSKIMITYLFHVVAMPEMQRGNLQWGKSSFTISTLFVDSCN